MAEPEVKYYINVNKHTIAANARNNTNLPPVRVSRGKSGKGVYCHSAEIPAGSRIIYSASEPILKCGAKLVIECPSKPEILE